MEQKHVFLSALSVGVGLGVGLGLSSGQAVQKWVGGNRDFGEVSEDQIVEELKRLLVDGKDSKVTFDEFPYYLSERTRVLLTSAAYVHLKHLNFSKHTRNLSPASRAILLSGPAELYQQMLAKALAHYFESKLLLLDVTDFSVKLQSRFGYPRREPCHRRSISEMTLERMSGLFGSFSTLPSTGETRGIPRQQSGECSNNLPRLRRNASAASDLSSSSSQFKPHHHNLQFSTLLFLLFLPFLNSQTPRQENTTGYTCSTTKNQTNNYPCQSYAFYRATSPNYLDLATISDLFSLSRLQISKPSNISSPSTPLLPNQPLLIPITCSCNFINTTFGSISYSNITYTIKPKDTFFIVSTINFQNLTTYPSVEVVNPNLVATNLAIGVNAVFPIFCKCPAKTRNSSSFMISYVVQPSDSVSSIALMFGATEKSIVDVNGGKLYDYDTIFVPVDKLPVLKQPSTVAVPSPAPSRNSNDGGGGGGDDKSGIVRGLAIGLGILGLLLILMLGIWLYREILFKKGKKDRDIYFGEKGRKGDDYNKKKGMDVNFMANVSDCLDKYRVFGFDELVEATDGFDESFLIQGCVYKGEIDGQVYAIKKMKWNAYEELKILQKVNHGNLVKLEGFCIEPEESNCYLVYEYVENGSLYSWLHEDKNEKLSWVRRLRVAIDIANGLLYIHEHTRPKVVHKDIKSSNILLDSNMRAKIANFGLAKSGINAITMHIVGTQGYISPEYLTDGVVSTKMDVFSFGVVLLELISGKEVIDEEGNVLWASAIKTFEVKNEQEKARRLKEWLDKAILKETLSMESLMGVLSVAIACLHRDPTKRPSIIDIVYSLTKCEENGFELSDDGFSSQRLVAR